MADPQPKPEADKVELDRARLYLGENDSAWGFFSTTLGDVAIASVADAEKDGPNEDSAAIIPVDDEHLVLAVADGVGGLAGAKAASNLTLRTLRRAVSQGADAAGRGVRMAILDGIETANRAVLKLGNGAASTLAVAELGRDYIRTYHVGDSIVLLCGQRGKVKFQTVPHSPVGFGVEAGLLDEEEALHHEERNLVFNVIGSPDMRIEIGSRQFMAPLDTLLVASDGLTDNLMQDEIVEAVRAGPVDKAIRTVTDMAGSRMETEEEGRPSKPDDLTTVLFRRALTMSRPPKSS